MILLACIRSVSILHIQLRLEGQTLAGAVILVVLLGIYAAVAGRFEVARPRFRTISCGLGLLMIVQELCYLLLAPAQVLSVPGFSPATAAMLAAFFLLLCVGLCYPPVREVFPILEEADEEEAQTQDE